MSATATPIRRKLMTMILATSGAVLLVTTASFFTYELVTFRQATVRNLSILGELTASNSSAALAFDNEEDANDVLAALKADRHIVAAALYDEHGNLFATYPAATPASEFPAQAGVPGYRFEHAHIVGLQPVMEGDRRMGMLFLKADMGAMYERFSLYGLITALITILGGVLAYLMSRMLQHQVSRPILALAETARAVSDKRDYSVRATESESAELGVLTGAFNHMLTQIQQQHVAFNAQLARLSLLQHVTRAIGERQDLPSIFQVALGSLEDNLPIDFGCVCLHDAGTETLVSAMIGARSQALSPSLELTNHDRIPIDLNGLTRCMGGALVYEPDVRQVDFPFPQRFARAGLHSLVLAPLIVENKVFGVFVAARRDAGAFTSPECEFLRQLSEHVALASHQSQLYTALQQAYEDLRQSQHTVMQHERLRALGQMASGIAHDINNAISPVSLYTESLLEREPNLSERARSYLVTIQRAIDDVAGTVARMREFYRQREPQLQLARIQLNRIIEQIVELTRARWSDLPQQRGVVVDLQVDLTPDLPEIMGAEGEIRDALTNLVFNAVDAMPEGGRLTLRTRLVHTAAEEEGADSVKQVHVEVSDTGIGMDEETRRRCLEPFFTTKGERGTGLGLAMVYGMIQRHSAELQVDSEAGKGTTMRLVFPAFVQDSASTARLPALQLLTQRLRILVVDDDPMLIKSLQDTLESEGHAITAANGGQSGIDLFTKAWATQTPFDVVITDLGMPYVDGRKVAASIRAVSAGTPIIMLTGWGQRMLAENDIPAHVDRVLSKPPRLHELRTVLAELTTREARTETA